MVRCARSASYRIRTINYTYDAAGRLASASDPDSSYSYGYDDLGRVTSISNAGTNGMPTVVLNQQYDATGRRSELSATIDDTADFTNSYSYDGDGRVTNIAQSGSTAGNSVAGKLVDFGYDAAGN